MNRGTEALNMVTTQLGACLNMGTGHQHCSTYLEYGNNKVVPVLSNAT